MRDLSCEEVVERLPALVAGDLESQEIAEIEAHTLDCWECDVDLRQSRGLSAALQTIARAPEIETAAPSHSPASLHARLQAALPRIASFAPVDTELGTMHLVVTDQGIARVFFPDADESDVEYWCLQNDFVPLFDEEPIEPYAEQLREYFSGLRTNFDVLVDLRTVTPFMRRVLEALRSIPYGDVRNYRDIAMQIGNPNAQRAVGNAVKRNPVPIVVPCHRVIRTDGTIGGYAGGPVIKERLLKLEGALLTT